MPEGIQDLFSLQQGGVTGIDETAYEALTFPLELPSSPGFRRLRIRPQRAQVTSESEFTLESQVQASAGERWIAEVTLPLMKRAQAAPWQGFFALLDGKAGTFMLGDPLARQPLGNPLGNPIVRDPNQTGKVLALSGAVPNTPNWLRAGDYFQIGDRLHQVGRDAHADSAGFVILDFWPRLRQIYDVNTPIITANCKGLFRMTSPTWDHWEADEQQLYSISFVAEEAL